MQIPLQISFRNMDPSPAVEATVREKAAKLDRYFERIVSWDAERHGPRSRRRIGATTRASCTKSVLMSACLARKTCM